MKNNINNLVLRLINNQYITYTLYNHTRQQTSSFKMKMLPKCDQES